MGQLLRCYKIENHVYYFSRFQVGLVYELLISEVHLKDLCELKAIVTAVNTGFQSAILRGMFIPIMYVQVELMNHLFDLDDTFCTFDCGS